MQKSGIWSRMTAGMTATCFLATAFATFAAPVQAADHATCVADCNAVHDATFIGIVVAETICLVATSGAGALLCLAAALAAENLNQAQLTQCIHNCPADPV